MQIANLDRDLDEACQILKDLSQDEELRRQAEYREKAWRDEIDRLEGARAEGIEQGKLLKNIEVFKNLKSMGMEINKIKQVLNLSESEFKNCVES